MTKANALHGWREPNEDPVPECPLLAVYKDKVDNIVFITTEHSSIERVRKWKFLTLLAWQYLPVWEEETKYE